MHPLSADRGVLPPNYHEVLYWKITELRSRGILMNLLAVPLTGLCCVLLGAWIFFFGRLSEVSLGASSLDLVWILLTILLTIPLHELVHGICMRVFGAHPRFGFLPRMFMFYATSPGYAFPRNQYLAVALAPLVILSLLAGLGIVLLAGHSILLLIAVGALINGSGAIGDLWMSVIVLRYPVPAYVIDERDGMRIFLPQEDGRKA